MKVILCFGDSNTYGRDPVTKGRLDRKTRWPGVLQNTLGEKYYVIEEGLNGRTTVWDDPVRGGPKKTAASICYLVLNHTPRLIYWSSCWERMI